MVNATDILGYETNLRTQAVDRKVSSDQGRTDKPSSDDEEPHHRKLDTLGQEKEGERLAMQM
jgi:hypothetical protein